MRKASFLLLFLVIAALGQAQEIGIEPPPGTYHRDVSLPRPAGEWEFRFEGARLFRQWDRPLNLSALSGQERRFVLEIQPKENPEARRRLVYVIDRLPPATPAASPAPGIFSEAISVALEAAEGELFYQVIPGAGQNVEYTRPIELSGIPGTVTSYEIQAVPVDAQGNSGGIERFRYVIDRSQEEEPYLEIISPVSGRFANQQLLYVVSQGLSSIRYTLDGSDPRTGGDSYVGPILIAREGAIDLRVAGTAADGEAIERRVTYEGGSSSVVAAPQGYHDAPLFVDPAGQRTFRYRLDDSSVSRTDTSLSRALEIRPLPGTLRPVILRLNDAPGTQSPDYRYTFLLDGRDVRPPLIHLFQSESDALSFALEREVRVETEYAVLVNGRPYRSGIYEGPTNITLPSGAVAGEGVLRARSRSGSGPWSAYAEARFVFSTAPPELVEVEATPQGPSPAKTISFTLPPEHVVRYELYRVTEPPRRVGSSSGVLQNGASLSIPFGTSARMTLGYAVFDAQGNASEESSIEIVLDHEPPAEPEISFDDGRIRIRGTDETYYRVVRDDVEAAASFMPYRGPTALERVTGRRVGYLIEAFSQDEVGNVSAVVRRTVDLDERSLEVPKLLGIEDGGRYSEESVTILPAVRLPGLDLHYTVSTDGTTPPAPTEASPVLQDAVELFGIEGETVGVYLRLRVRNRRTGRFGPLSEIRFVIDREPPELPTVVGVENGGVYRGGRELALTGIEPGSQAFIAITEERNFRYFGPVLIDVPEGEQQEFSVSVEIVDAAGNVTRSAFPLRFVVDRDPPQAPQVDIVHDEESTLLRLAGGDGRIFYNISQKPSLPGMPTETSSLYTGPLPLDGGRYLVSAIEVDAAGNRSPVRYSSEITVLDGDNEAGPAPVVLVSWEGRGAVLLWPYAHQRDLYYRISVTGEPPTDEPFRLYEEPKEISLMDPVSQIVVEYYLESDSDSPGSLSVSRPPDAGAPEVSPGDGTTSREEIAVSATGRGTLRYELSTSGPAQVVSRRSPEWPGNLRLSGRDGESIVYRLSLRAFTETGASREVSHTFVVDQSPPPAPRLVNAEDGEFYDESRRVEFENGQGDVLYRIVRNPASREPEADFRQYREPVLLEAVEGELSNYRIEAYSVDEVGNRSPNTAVWNVYIDQEIIYVSPGGSDRGSGTRESPFRTLGRAITYARESDRETIFLAAGVYEIASPLRTDEALAVQGRFDPDTWRPGSSAETLIIPSEDFSGEALVVSYRGPLTMSRLALLSSAPFDEPLILVDDVTTTLDAVSLSSSAGPAIEARGGDLTLRGVTLEQSGTASEAVILRGTAGTIESSIIRAGSFGNDRAIAVDLRDSASLTVSESRLEAYGISRATAISVTNGNVEVSQSTIRVGASRGNAQAVSARNGAVLVEQSVLSADDQTRVANLVVTRDVSLALLDSLLELSADQGAVGVVASGGQLDVRSTRFVGTSLNDFTYGVQARGIEGIFANNVFQAGQVGEYIAGSLVNSPTQWVHNTFLGYRASPFIQILNLRGSGETIFGNNLALQGTARSGSGLVLSGGHRLEMRGNLFGGWASVLTTDDQEVASLGLLESGRIRSVVAQDNDVLPAGDTVGRDGVPYRLLSTSPAIDRGVELPGSEEIPFDIEGQRRPAPVPPDGSFRRSYEGRPDVGADEYYP